MAGKMIEQERYTCAIGALQSVVAIPKALPILHSGPGCGMMVRGFFERSTGYAGGSTSPCTNFSESEVVFGGIEKLRKIIANSYKILNSDLQVILTGCTAGIVGDDIDSLADEFREAGRPIVTVETAGFKSNNFVAHSDVVKAIIDQYTNIFVNDNPVRSEKKTINLFASIPYQDQFWKGNLRTYKYLLEQLGFKVHVLFGPESDGVAEWQQIPRANFNVLISPWYGQSIVEHLENIYEQPFFKFPHIPIGANETEKFLHGVLKFAEGLNVRLDYPKAENFIKRASAAYYEELDNLATFLLEFRYGLPSYVHIIHDAGYVTGLAKFLLHETGIVPKEQFIVDNTPEKFQQSIREDLQSISAKKIVPLTFEPDAGKVQDIVRNIVHEGRGLLIGSGWDKELSREKGFDFISASVPSPYRLVLSTGYAGFHGGLRVMEDIFNTVLASYR
ncbi:nitrogenase component 1 [Pectinatus haikarae]|uniref:Nitrogenase molybdenum-iron protein beta chain n=1 Tax=Pectinatus haikarae TaxID=349096 RepID=A0ABT9Y9L7_9FIRM|nr:nitrogenase component 1 [Pectinatus haikarae]MDQ0204531.1 nitrogenase molybdenum-iron protein beta chain [Pectinatus haikarae]